MSRNDPVSTKWWSQHPACQRCFYKPFRNCHPSRRVSTPPVETLIFDKEDPFLIQIFDKEHSFLSPIFDKEDRFFDKEDWNPVCTNHRKTAQIAASGFLNKAQWRNRPNSRLQFLSGSFHVPGCYFHVLTLILKIAFSASRRLTFDHLGFY